MLRRTFVCALLAALTLSTLACGPDDETTPLTQPETGIRVRQSVEQLAVTHAPPGTTLELTDSTGKLIQSGVADALGSLMFREVPPGEGYAVRAKTSPEEVRSPLRVMTVDESKPAQSFYDEQVLDEGFGYITTRDGTKLSAFVTMPGPADKGPYPTIVDYSGYDPSRPGEPLKDFCKLLGDQFPTVCNPPSDGSGLLASFLGYATVSVNMRGTGCSGGAYDYFETMQLLDGYDVIEAVGAQSWVAFHKVGMTGLSYPGITQLFTAKMEPPSLAAITPLSVIGNTVTTLVPGGILNDGFALSWVSHVLDRADPYGQGWEEDMVKAGDKICEENQLLHGQKVDNVAQAEETPYYIPEKHARYNPAAFVDKINVPVFMAGAYQDEQTGPYFTDLFSRLTHAPNKRFIVYNGVHRDGFQPAVMAEWKAFLDIYVAHKVPSIDDDVRPLGPTLFEQIFHAKLDFPDDRWGGVKTWEEAKAKWEAEPEVHALFESGAGKPSSPGAPISTFEMAFKTWPPAETTVARYYFQPDGSLTTTAPADATAASSFLLDPEAGQRSNLAEGGDIEALLPQFDWRSPTPGHAVVAVSAALDADQLMFGTASADLWVKSTADDADLQVSITEVRPDQQEMYVQSGLVRASMAKLGPDSTELAPEATLLKEDIEPLTPGEWRSVRILIPAFGHVFRKGSRVRVIVGTPGGSHAQWRFRLKTFPGAVTHTIGHDWTHASSIALPLIASATVTTPLPPCPSLRGQPCRDYVAYTNKAASP
jgi:predicted acyl esterase